MMCQPQQRCSVFRCRSYPDPIVRAGCVYLLPPLSAKVMSDHLDRRQEMSAADYATLNDQPYRAVTVQENWPANAQLDIGAHPQHLIGREGDAAAAYVYRLAGPGDWKQVAPNNPIRQRQIEGKPLL
jgi:hypothetical protein